MKNKTDHVTCIPISSQPEINKIKFIMQIFSKELDMQKRKKKMIKVVVASKKSFWVVLTVFQKYFLFCKHVFINSINGFRD